MTIEKSLDSDSDDSGEGLYYLPSIPLPDSPKQQEHSSRNSNRSQSDRSAPVDFVLTITQHHSIYDMRLCFATLFDEVHLSYCSNCKTVKTNICNPGAIDLKTRLPFT